MQTEYIATVSKAVKTDIETHYNRCTDISVICPGVDTNLYIPTGLADKRVGTRRELSIEKHEKVVLFVGSEFKRKGLDLVIKALKGKDYRLLVVGRGDKYQNYKKLVEESGIAKKTIFTGLSTNVLNYYAAADLVVLPSRSEAFGMSILEGMSCGLPVAVSSTAGVAGLVKDRVNGFTLRSVGDLEDLLSNLPGPETLKGIGKAARETALAYSWQHVADQYEALFHRVAREHRKR